MTSKHHFQVVNIPLNRQDIISFLVPPQSQRRGAALRIIGHRLNREAEATRIERLRHAPTLAALMAHDDPHAHLTEITTDRLVPVEFLRDDPEYLTRNLGGWSPVYFAMIDAPDADWHADPLLRHAEVLTEYGETIRYFGADFTQVESRLSDEMGYADVETVAQAFVRLYDWRHSAGYDGESVDSLMAYTDKLYAQIATDGDLLSGSGDSPAIPRHMLTDDLLGQMVRIELRRREAVADGNARKAAHIATWQRHHQDESGLLLILKGEYIMGRHRRSTVLIAPELNVVVKQPGPEPFHEALIGGRTHKGKRENWPTLTRDGSLVTAAGRLRLVIEDGLIEQLNSLFHHDVHFLSSLGLIIEPFITGPTLQDYILTKPERLTDDLYDFIVLHQQVCERLNVENGDWHSANFIVMEDQPNPFMDGLPAMVHIDWGAARKLEDDEHTPHSIEGRIDQVQNIAYSFHDETLAKRVMDMHKTFKADAGRIERLKTLADRLVIEAGFA